MTAAEIVPRAGAAIDVQPRDPGLSIAAVVLTFNEELNLPACLTSLKQLGCEIFVVDSGSTDRTVDIAKLNASHVVEHAFENQAQQLNWALANLPLAADWVLRLDADERLTPELIAEIRATLPTLSVGVTGLFVKRRVYFMGRWMKHGGYYPTWIMRLWRRGAALAEQRAMDEHMLLREGYALKLKHDIKEENAKGLFEWTARQNGYSSREVLARMSPDQNNGVQSSLRGTPEARRRWFKHKVYYRFPMLLRAWLYFIWRYVFLLGFLDGREGLIFHFLQGCWLRFLIDAKLFESRRSGQKGSISQKPE